ncbi:LacI family DNA-binding transcriptional regulator [Winogradskya consettensis]|uniref:Transcriptional regulator n=1 Tax=Winogradskya consettensis TaxID=113560 RepID=A0A919VL28_9ACTN|nr:substrate-binding domain-containing protein [Actinoplanes consettensis]GIM70164.1 transcriptional regulator [Actinoplanes consettensis]
MSREQRATLDEVAARAGVSKATASKVLNRRPGISAATRRRVDQALHDLGYAPTTARDPRTTRVVTAVFDTLTSLYSLRVLEGAVDAAREHGADLVTTTLVTGSTAIPVDAVAAKGHIGLLVITTRIGPEVVRACAGHGIALIAVDPPDALDDSVVSIGSHHWAGGLQATSHLLRLGHRRIAFVGGSPHNQGLRERFGGYREALDAAGVPPDPDLISQDGIGSGEAAVRRMLALPRRPTAVFATTDGDAFAAIRAARAHGLRVPTDLSVAGYDDTYAIAATDSRLTTVSTPMHEIGRTALRTLLAMADGEPPISRHLRLATTLITRETTAPPP